MKQLVLFFGILLFAGSLQAQIAVKADTIYTMAGKKLVNGVILIKDDKIEKVGESVRIPKDYKVYEAKVVTPGLIDIRSSVGLAGAFNASFDRNALEKSSPMQPELRAIDAYNPDDELVGWLRQNGITTIHTGHRPGALMSGQTMVVKTKKGTVDEVVIVPEAMVAMSMGRSVSGNFGSPGNPSKEMAILRSTLLKEQAKLKKQTEEDKPVTNLKSEMYKKLLNREIPALIHVHTSQQILNAIRLADEFNLDLVLEGVAEAYRVIPQIKEADAKVIIHPTMMRGGGEKLNMTMENAAILNKAGFPALIESGFEAYVPKTRVVLLESAVAVANGLDREQALLGLTKHAAELLEIDDRVGTIEKGKDADIVLFNGDPFEYTTKPCIVIIDGKVEATNCE